MWVVLSMVSMVKVMVLSEKVCMRRCFFLRVFGRDWKLVGVVGLSVFGKKVVNVCVNGWSVVWERVCVSLIWGRVKMCNEM